MNKFCLIKYKYKKNISIKKIWINCEILFENWYKKFYKYHYYQLLLVSFSFINIYFDINFMYITLYVHYVYKI